MGGNVYKGLVAEEVRSEIHETPSVNSVVVILELGVWAM